MKLFPLVCVLLLHVSQARDDDDDEPYDPYTTTDPKKREPSPCEVCKFFITELKSRLDETAKSKAVIETGYSFDVKKRKKKAYRTSELRLTEALHEPHICEKILEYNVHAERKGSNRYAKGMSETFSTLHGLVNKGVKVELGIPYDLWDEPSAEVRKMQRICFKLAESYEENIEEWYYNYQDTENIMEYICRERYLKDMKWDDTCLNEEFVPKDENEEEEPEPEKDEPPKDPKQARRDKEKIDRLIAEQAEEQRIGHKLYKGEMGGPEAEKKKKEKKAKKSKKKKENKQKGESDQDQKEEVKKEKRKKLKKEKKGDTGHPSLKDEL